MDGVESLNLMGQNSGSEIFKYLKGILFFDADHVESLTVHLLIACSGRIPRQRRQFVIAPYRPLIAILAKCRSSSVQRGKGIETAQLQLRLTDIIIVRTSAKLFCIILETKKCASSFLFPLRSHLRQCNEPKGRESAPNPHHCQPNVQCLTDTHSPRARALQLYML